MSNIRSHQFGPQAEEEGARTGTGRCYGTFGELLQGVLPVEGREFLVTLPISQYSTARFTISPGSRKVHVCPSHKVKSGRLAEKLTDILGLDSGGTLSIWSELPAGKGCASSSDDMVATARALQAASGASVSRKVLARIMSSIEASDGVMYPGIVSFYHREGVLRKFLGYLPSMTIVGLDTGGQVDTVEFNKRPKPFDSARRAEYKKLLIHLERAVARKDLWALGEISTHSAILNQKLLPKPHLELLLEMRRRHGALGVVGAHSGTQLGLLLGPDPSNGPRDPSAVVAELRQYSPDVFVYRTLDFRAQ